MRQQPKKTLRSIANAESCFETQNETSESPSRKSKFFAMNLLIAWISNDYLLA